MTARERRPGTEEPGAEQTDRDEGPCITVPRPGDGRHGNTTLLAELVARILATDRPTYEAGWADGYRYGYTSGWDVGYGHAVHVRDEQWRLAATPIVELCRRVPAYAELERRRNAPHGDAYAAALARRGGREYLGGPVDWATGREAAR